jgi:orotidine-5'-phosphate decarboxylase
MHVGKRGGNHPYTQRENSMTSFTERLRTVQSAQQSLLCIGLDTDITKLPSSLPRTPDGVLEFNKRVIDATHDLVCAYKLNLAFYEALGCDGWRVLHETRRHIPASVIAIADGKRGDIGNSSELYARALINELQFDASTVHPYMGRDSLEPFFRNAEHGVFVLALTSNEGAKDLQYLKSGAKPLYEHVITRVKRWNTRQNLGIVAGATRPAQLKRIRTLAPGLPLLIPGVGAQGGDMKKAVQYGCDKNGLLAIINAGRNIIYASSGEEFANAARTAAMEMREQINQLRIKN